MMLMLFMHVALWFINPILYYLVLVWFLRFGILYWELWLCQIGCPKVYPHQRHNWTWIPHIFVFLFFVFIVSMSTLSVFHSTRQMLCDVVQMFCAFFVGLSFICIECVCNWVFKCILPINCVHNWPIFLKVGHSSACYTTFVTLNPNNPNPTFSNYT